MKGLRANPALAWAMMMARAMRDVPKEITRNRSHSPHQGEQECARRRRQMAKHGENYWCPVWRG